MALMSHGACEVEVLVWVGVRKNTSVAWHLLFARGLARRGGHDATTSASLLLSSSAALGMAPSVPKKGVEVLVAACERVGRVDVGVARWAERGGVGPAHDRLTTVAGACSHTSQSQTPARGVTHRRACASQLPQRNAACPRPTIVRDPTRRASHRGDRAFGS